MESLWGEKFEIKKRTQTDLGEVNKSNRIILTHQDCIKFLNTIDNDSVDLALIDPPYGISRDSNFCKSSDDSITPRVNMNFGDWDNSFDKLDEVILEIYRVLKPGGTLICFYDIWKLTTLREWFENARFNQIRFIEWVKTNPAPINSKLNYLTNAREIAVTGVKGGNPTFNSVHDNGIYNYPLCADEGKFHPTQKPVELIKALIEKHSNIGELVLDCFSGSGTTAAAAYLTNRNFIGCELDDEYYIKSVDRLKMLGAL